MTRSTLWGAMAGQACAAAGKGLCRAGITANRVLPRAVLLYSKLQKPLKARQLDGGCVYAQRQQTPADRQGIAGPAGCQTQRQDQGSKAGQPASKLTTSPNARLTGQQACKHRTRRRPISGQRPRVVHSIQDAGARAELKDTPLVQRVLVWVWCCTAPDSSGYGRWRRA